MEQNNRPLGWTTVEEAQQLIEAGLNPDTADMYWAPDAGTVVPTPYITKTDDETLIPAYKGAIPCWSLGALLELIPAEITYSDFEPFKLGISKDDNKDKSHYFIQYYSLYEGGVFCETYGYTLVEASINMILYLLSNEFIKYEQEKC